jgi:hypothetical protein
MMHAPLLGMHQEPKKQKPPDIRRLLSAEILASELKFRTSSGNTAHGTVASPHPVAGLG